MASKNTRKTFLGRKWPFILAILYVLLPIDFIPDILPVGALDDTAVLILELIRQYNQHRNDVKKD